MLLGRDASAQRELDLMMNELDGTPNKSDLGANAILSVSLALARVTAVERGVALYEYLAELDHSPGRYSMPVPMIFASGSVAPI